MSAKFKVTHLKRVSHSHLELQGTLFYARLFNKVIKVLCRKGPFSIHLYFNSWIILHWSKGSAHKKKFFLRKPRQKDSNSNRFIQLISLCRLQDDNLLENSSRWNGQIPYSFTKWSPTNQYYFKILLLEIFSFRSSGFTFSWQTDVQAT